jgi:hypothetical protein
MLVWALCQFVGSAYFLRLELQQIVPEAISPKVLLAALWKQLRGPLLLLLFGAAGAYGAAFLFADVTAGMVPSFMQVTWVMASIGFVAGAALTALARALWRCCYNCSSKHLPDEGAGSYQRLAGANSKSGGEGGGGEGAVSELMGNLVAYCGDPWNFMCVFLLRALYAFAARAAVHTAHIHRTLHCQLAS